MHLFQQGVPLGTASSVTPQKKGLSALVLLAEVGVIGVILYLFRWLLSPTASISITPSHSTESIVYNFLITPAASTEDFSNKPQLQLQYSTWYITTTEELTFPLQKIEYEITNARIEATITNTLPSAFSLVQWTTFTTEEGIIFKTDVAVTIPAAEAVDWENIILWTTKVYLDALPYQENWLPIGERGNLHADTHLYIKNLAESNEDKLIYAIPDKLIQQWATTERGIVHENDVANVEASLRNMLQQRKKELLYQHVKQWERIIVPFDELITLEVQNFSTTTPAGSTWSTVEWEVTYRIDYVSISRADLEKSIHKYLSQRPQDVLTLLALQRQNIIFYTPRETWTGVYIVPTKFDVLRGYNFSDDTTNLLEDMRAKIAGKTKQEAHAILIWYEQVWNIDITIRPPRYDTLPPIASRIDFSRKK